MIMEFDFDYEPTIEDFCQICECLGFDVSPRDVQFSGFWSQGDGASFTGNYSYRKGCVKAIMGYAPQDKILHAIARDIVDMQRPVFYRIEGPIYRRSHHYSHENTIRADSDDLTEIARRLCQWLYRTLESEYEYQQAWRAGSLFARHGEEIADTRAELLELLRERRAVRGLETPALCAALRDTVRRGLARISKARQSRAELLESYSYYAAFLDGAKC